MQIVGALDVHRRQITTKTLDLESGEVRRGRIISSGRPSSLSGAALPKA